MDAVRKNAERNGLVRASVPTLLEMGCMRRAKRQTPECTVKGGKVKSVGERDK